MIDGLKEDSVWKIFPVFIGHKGRTNVRSHFT